jgi:diaminohydroxyphosphoribosylaminopyrimidine deaminase/5-amino-6-(5-phosphoribosylamino)uracil reductase
MHHLPEDESHLHHALALARDAVGLASPNPTVGCVLARGDEVLGEGAHFYDAFDHAEIAALKNAAVLGHDVRNATAYVTLEPCSHHGRTGPCANALIAAGIGRCVVATVDPNPQVSGSGIARMRDAGIEVSIADPASPPAKQARLLNDAFAWTIQHHRPFITLKAALSVDGRLAPPISRRTATAPHWLTGEAARADVQQLRHSTDAILTGIGTILADDPLLSDRTGLARRRPLLRIVLDSQLRTPLDSQLVRSAANDVLILCHSSAPTDRMQALRERHIEVVALAGEAVTLDLSAVIKTLEGRKLLSILVEAGTALNGSFLAAGLVDKAVLYFSETELGTDALPFAAGFASPYVLQQQLQRTGRRTFPHGSAEDVRIAGYLHDPWAGVDSTDSLTC